MARPGILTHMHRMQASCTALQEAWWSGWRRRPVSESSTSDAETGSLQNDWRIRRDYHRSGCRSRMVKQPSRAV